MPLSSNGRPKFQTSFRFTEEAALRFAAGIREKISAWVLPNDLEKLTELTVGSVKVNMKRFLTLEMKQD